MIDKKIHVFYAIDSDMSLCARGYLCSNIDKDGCRGRGTSAQKVGSETGEHESGGPLILLKKMSKLVSLISCISCLYS